MKTMTMMMMMMVIRYNITLLTLALLTLQPWMCEARLAMLHYGQYGGLQLHCDTQQDIILIRSQILGYSASPRECAPSVGCSRPYTLATWYCRGKKGACTGMQVERWPLNGGTCTSAFTNCLRIEYDCVPDSKPVNICSSINQTITPHNMTIDNSTTFSHDGVSGMDGYITSPQFPAFYPPSQHCSCHLSVDSTSDKMAESQGAMVVVETILVLMKADQPCRDWLEIETPTRRYRSCGYIPKRRTYQGREVTVSFASDTTTNDMGFWVKYYVTGAATVPDVNLVCGAREDKPTVPTAATTTTAAAAADTTTPSTHTTPRTSTPAAEKPEQATNPSRTTDSQQQITTTAAATTTATTSVATTDAIVIKAPMNTDDVAKVLRLMQAVESHLPAASKTIHNSGLSNTGSKHSVGLSNTGSKHNSGLSNTGANVKYRIRIKVPKPFTVTAEITQPTAKATSSQTSATTPTVSDNVPSHTTPASPMSSTTMTSQTEGTTPAAATTTSHLQPLILLQDPRKIQRTGPPILLRAPNKQKHLRTSSFPTVIVNQQLNRKQDIRRTIIHPNTNVKNNIGKPAKPKLLIPLRGDIVHSKISKPRKTIQSKTRRTSISENLRLLYDILELDDQDVLVVPPNRTTARPIQIPPTTLPTVPWTTTHKSTTSRRKIDGNGNSFNFGKYQQTLKTDVRPFQTLVRKEQPKDITVQILDNLKAMKMENVRTVVKNQKKDDKPTATREPHINHIKIMKNKLETKHLLIPKNSKNNLVKVVPNPRQFLPENFYPTQKSTAPVAIHKTPNPAKSTTKQYSQQNPELEKQTPSTAKVFPAQYEGSKITKARPPSTTKKLLIPLITPVPNRSDQHERIDPSKNFKSSIENRTPAHTPSVPSTRTISGMIPRYESTRQYTRLQQTTDAPVQDLQMIAISRDYPVGVETNWYNQTKHLTYLHAPSSQLVLYQPEPPERLYAEASRASDNKYQSDSVARSSSDSDQDVVSVNDTHTQPRSDFITAIQNNYIWILVVIASVAWFIFMVFVGVVLHHKRRRPVRKRSKQSRVTRSNIGSIPRNRSAQQRPLYPASLVSQPYRPAPPPVATIRQGATSSARAMPAPAASKHVAAPAKVIMPGDYIHPEIGAQRTPKPMRQHNLASTSFRESPDGSPVTVSDKKALLASRHARSNQNHSQQHSSENKQPVMHCAKHVPVLKQENYQMNRPPSQVSKTVGYSTRNPLFDLHNTSAGDDGVTAFNRHAPAPGTPDPRTKLTSMLNLNHNNIQSWAIRNINTKKGNPGNPHFVEEMPERDINQPVPAKTGANNKKVLAGGTMLSDRVSSIEALLGGQAHTSQHSVIHHWPSSSTVHATKDESSAIHSLNTTNMDSVSMIQVNKEGATPAAACTATQPPPPAPPLPTPGQPTPKHHQPPPPVIQMDPRDVDLEWTSSEESFDSESLPDNRSADNTGSAVHGDDSGGGAGISVVSHPEVHGSLDRLTPQDINTLSRMDPTGNLMNMYLPANSRNGSPNSNAKKLKKLIPKQAFLFNSAVQPELKKILLQRNLSDQSVIHV